LNIYFFSILALALFAHVQCMYSSNSFISATLLQFPNSFFCFFFYNSVSSPALKLCFFVRELNFYVVVFGICLFLLFDVFITIITRIITARHSLDACFRPVMSVKFMPMEQKTS